MRSLALKLTLAFLFVGLIGAVLVAVFVGIRTQREFDQFINDRYRQDMVQELVDYYGQHSGWQDISAIALRTPADTSVRRSLWWTPTRLSCWARGVTMLAKC